MNPLLDALSRALRDLFNLRALWVAVWPMLLAGALWLVLSIVFWSTFSGWIAQGLSALGVEAWLAEVEPIWIAHGVQLIAHLTLFMFVVPLTALLITALFAMPALIRLVAERDYPHLARERGGSLAGNLWNACVAVGVFIVLWVASAPLWLLGIGVIVPFVAAAYLNQRLFRYDALAEHASTEEMTAQFKNAQGGWWGLGLLTGLVQFVPLLNLLGPVFAALAFIHYGLARLNAARANGSGISGNAGETLRSD